MLCVYQAVKCRKMRKRANDCSLLSMVYIYIIFFVFVFCRGFGVFVCIFFFFWSHQIISSKSNNIHKLLHPYCSKSKIKKSFDYNNIQSFRQTLSSESCGFCLSRFFEIPIGTLTLWFQSRGNGTFPLRLRRPILRDILANLEKCLGNRRARTSTSPKPSTTNMWELTVSSPCILGFFLLSRMLVFEVKIFYDVIFNSALPFGK